MFRKKATHTRGFVARRCTGEVLGGSSPGVARERFSTRGHTPGGFTFSTHKKI